MEQAVDVQALLDLAGELQPLADKYPDTIIDNIYEWLKRLITDLINGGINTIRLTVGGITDKIKSFVSVVKDSITSKITTVETSIKNNLTNISNSIKATVNKVESNIKTFINDNLSGIGNIIGSAIDKLRITIASVVDAIRSVATEIGRVIANSLSGILSTIKTELQSIINAVKDSIKILTNGIVEGLIEFGSYIHDSILNAINKVKEFVTTLANNIKQSIENVVVGVRTTISNVIDAVKQYLSDVYDNVKSAITNVIISINDWINQLLENLKRVYEDIRKFVVDNGIKFIYWIDENVMPILNRSIDSSKMLFEIGQQLFDSALSGDYDKFNKIFDVGGKAVANELAQSAFGSFIYSIMLFYFNLQVRFIAPQYMAQRQAVINGGLEAPPLDLMVNAYRLGKVDKNDLLETLRLNGVSTENAVKALDGIRNLPTAGWIQEAYLRGFISEDEHDNYLKGHGFTDDDIEIFKLIYFRLPPVSDLIRMAVREAFSPDIAEKFGQYEDYPEAFDKLAPRIGLSPEWARAYWASHWDLPSPSMGFEMFHRGIIDEETLKLLLRALDIMPFWRDKLIELSYNPLTRVDIRRMYQLGVLTEDEVYKAYLDIGYSPENARRLTEFTKRYSAPEDESELSEFRRLARSTYTQAYRKNIISKDEYKQMLLGLGYVEDDVDLLISIDDVYIASQNDLFDENDFNKSYQSLIVKAYKNGIINKDDMSQILKDLGYTDNEVILQIELLDTEYRLYIKNLVADKIGTLYVEYTIDEQTCYNYLNIFGFSTFEIERYMQEWNINRSLRTRKPTLSDIVRFYRAGFISDSEFMDELRGLGYNERYVKMYANLYGV